MVGVGGSIVNLENLDSFSQTIAPTAIVHISPTSDISFEHVTVVSDVMVSH